MVFHILGYLTLAGDLVGGIWLGRRLWAVGSRPWTWQRQVPVPEAFELSLSSGSDYVGLV